MRTAEHMEHRNLERKWRPSLVLGPHLTEGRLNDERKSCCVCVRVAAFNRCLHGWLLLLVVTRRAAPALPSGGRAASSPAIP